MKSCRGLLIGIICLLFQIPCITGSSIAEQSERTSAAAAPVRLGIDNIEQHLGMFQGKRVGLITNATGMNSSFESTADILAAKTNLTALFGPEHGVRGATAAGDSVAGQVDAKTGLPVYSLYGATKSPTPEMLDKVDILAFDIQDIGTRSYTYIYTMANAMKAAKAAGKPFVVFDRPNPVGGLAVEGGIVKPGFESFVGMYPIPARHGMTVGELAMLFNQEFGIHCNLTVIKMTGWRRDMYFDQTGLPWVMTSPNIPTPDTALLYAATGIFGGANVSEGVGTTRPFEFVGAPWLDADKLAESLKQEKLPGVVFRPAHYIPRFGNFAGELCHGVQIHVVDRTQFVAVRTGLLLLRTVALANPEAFSFKTNAPGKPMIDLLTGDDSVRMERESTSEILARWDAEAAKFREISRQYYLY